MSSDIVLIGSRAMRHWFPRFPRFKDCDLVIREEVFENWAGKANARVCSTNKHKKLVSFEGVEFECEFDTLESNRQILNSDFAQSIEIAGLTCSVAPPELLLAIKRSHLYHADHWHKTVKDYLFLRRRATLDASLLALSDLRRSEKNTRRKRAPSLLMNNDAFFEGSQGFVNRVYVHDDLHFATCYYGEPLWMRCKHDLTKAYIDKDLFERMSLEDRVRMVQEEGFVIALERKIIPYGTDAKSAFQWAVMRIGTTLTSGWFRDFAIDNYLAVMDYRHDFVGLFETALEKGKIRPYAKLSVGD